MTDVAEREFMSDVLDEVVEHVVSARELCEVGEVYPKAKIKLHLLQAFTALQFALDGLSKEEPRHDQT